MRDRCVRSLASAIRTSLAASVRPCCRRRSASRLLATSLRSRAPLQSRNRARSLLSGPTKRGSRALAACEEIDENTPQSEAIKFREATRFISLISISQFGAAGWLDMRPDGLHHTKMVSAMFLTAIQRRHGLYLSVIAPTLVEKAAAGEHVTVADYKGDFLANSKKGDRTSKHNRVLRAAQNAIRARSVGSIILAPRGQGKARGDAAPQRHVRD